MSNVNGSSPVVPVAPIAAKPVRPWSYPAHAASKSAASARTVTEFVAPVTRVAAVPGAILGGFLWGLCQGTYQVLTETPVLAASAAAAPVAPAMPAAGPTEKTVAQATMTEMANLIAQAVAHTILTMQVQAEAHADSNGVGVPA